MQPKQLLLAVSLACTLASCGPPNPVLYLVGTEAYSTGGKDFIRYNYDVQNKDQYPAEMFAGPGLAAVRAEHQFIAHLGRFLRQERQSHLWLLRARLAERPQQDLVCA